MLGHPSWPKHSFGDRRFARSAGPQAHAISVLKFKIYFVWGPRAGIIFVKNIPNPKNDNFFKSSSYKALKLGIYLQDTCDIYGGGIKVVPNTHKYFPFKSKLQRFENLFKKLSSLLAKKVNIKAGDAILFNHKLLHRGIWPLTFKSFNQKPSQECINKLMLNNEKIVVYWNVLNKNSSNKFLENSFKRSVQQEVLSRHHLHNYFTDYLSLSFPKDYNKEFVNKLNKEKILISTLDDRKIKLIKYINNNILK